MGDQKRLNIQVTDVFKIFAPDKFFTILVNPLWLWYMLLVFVTFSYLSPELPKELGNHSGAVLMLNLCWFFGSIAVSLDFILYKTFAAYRNDGPAGLITFFAVAFLLMGGMIGFFEAFTIISYNSTQLFGHSLGWLFLIALPFNILFIGNLVYMLVTSIKE